MSEATMTFRLDTDLKASFAQAAAAADRTAAQLLREFMRNYVQSQKEKKEEKQKKNMFFFTAHHHLPCVLHFYYPCH